MVNPSYPPASDHPKYEGKQSRLHAGSQAEAEQQAHPGDTYRAVLLQDSEKASLSLFFIFICGVNLWLHLGTYRGGLGGGFHMRFFVGTLGYVNEIAMFVSVPKGLTHYNNTWLEKKAKET